MRPSFPAAVMVMLLPAMAAAETEPADFTGGLARLAELGLPEMSGATWVKRPKGLGEGYEQSYQFRELGVRLKGGAWKVPGEPPRLIEFAGATELKSAKQEEDEQEAEKPAGKPSLLERMLQSHADKQPDKPRKREPGSLLETDVAGLVEALGNPGVMAEIIDDLSYRGQELPGKCLIFAAQLQAAGKSADANRLAAAIFSAFPDRSGVIDAAVNEFASADYSKATAAFFKDRDWQAYHRTLADLLAKYPRGWSDSLAVAMLMPHLEKRATGTLPPAPSLPGIDLDPAALEALADLFEPATDQQTSDEDLAEAQGIDLEDFPAEQRAEILAMLRTRGVNMGSRSSGLWLLDPAPEKPPADPAGRLKALGMDGLVALAAVATDDTLLPLPNSGSRSTYYGSNESAEEAALRSYRSMSRPQSRGEFATRMLAASVPLGEDTDESDAELLRDAAVAFWREHRTKSQVDLAAVFLSEGNDTQRSQAAAFLASSEAPEAAAAFEKIVLDAGDPTVFASEVENYLDRKKEAAKPFFDAYSTKLAEALDGVDIENMRYSSGSYAIREAGSVEKYLKTLSVKVGATSLEELVDEALKAESGEDTDSPIAALGASIARIPMEKCLIVIGKAMAGASEAQGLELHMLLLNRTYREHRNPESEDAGPRELSAELLDVWRPLLEKTDTLPEKESFASWARAYGAETTGDASALILEVAISPESRQRFNSFGDIAGSLAKVAPFVRERVDARIAGKPPAPWPDASRVTAERKQEIETKLGTLAAGEITPFAESLDLDERMAFVEILASYGDDKPAPAALLELRDTVVALRPYNVAMSHDPELLEKLGIGEGYRVTVDGLKGLAEKLAVGAKEFSGTTVSLYQAPMQLGYLASAARTTEFSPDLMTDSSLGSLAQWFDYYENPEALSMVAAASAGDFWALKDGKAVALEARRSAMEQIKTTINSKAVRTLYLHVEVITREDAAKINDQESEEE